jgi:hypothetical protein
MRNARRGTRRVLARRRAARRGAAQTPPGMAARPGRGRGAGGTCEGHRHFARAAVAAGEVEGEAALVAGEAAGGQRQVGLADAAAARTAAARTAGGRGLRDGSAQAGPGVGGLGDEEAPAGSRAGWLARRSGQLLRPIGRAWS